MKQISDKQWKKNITDLIEDKMTRVELAKKLKTDYRTLNNEIILFLKEKDTDLLQRFIEKFPYQPKTKENINYEALLIQILKNNQKVIDILEHYNIPERTYRRKINKVGTENNQLYQVYKRYIRGCLTEEDEEYIALLKEETVTYTNPIEDRKAQLMELFLKVEQLTKTGMKEKEIVEQLGETTKSLRRKENEINRILLEEKTDKRAKDFRNQNHIKGFKQKKIEKPIGRKGGGQDGRIFTDDAEIS